MWQCLPVKKDIVRISVLSFLIALITCSPSAVSAQSNIGINTVVDVKEDRSKTSATIVTAYKKPLPRPIIQFLQGENGNTVLVADFPEVVFPFSTKVINVNPAPLATNLATTGSAGGSGIRLVRIGRFQESPPICRVAIVSADPEKLKAVNFDSRSGSLVVRWPKSSSIISNGMPPHAPSPASKQQLWKRRAYQTSFNPPAVTPPTGEMASDFIPVPQPSQAYPTTIDPEIASSYGGLRGPMAEPTISRQTAPAGSPQRTARSVSGSAGYQPVSQPKELVAKQHTLATPVASPKKTTPPNTEKITQVTTNNAPLKVEKQATKLPPTAPPIAKREPGSQQPQPQPAKQQEEQIADASEKPGPVSTWLSKVKQKAKALLGPENPEAVQDEQPKVENTDVVSKSPVKPEPAAPQEEPSKTGLDSQVPPAQPSAEPPTVLLSENSGTGKGYTLKVVSPDKKDLNFTSFRLHNPERFVIDFQDLSSIQTVQVPQPENTEMLKSVRVGAPDPVKNTGRLVLDLAGEMVSVIPGDASSNNELSFVVGESSDPLIGLTAPQGATLVIDAGHGGTDPGAQRGFVKEKELTLAIAQRTREKLEKSGVKVVMTRGDDTFVPLPDRVSITNNLKPDAFLSVHINSLESTKDIHGIETYYQTDMSKALAQDIHESLVSELAAPDRAIRKAKFYVVNRAEVPAVLAEVGFISNKAERDKLVSEDYQEKIAGALAKGAILYLKQQQAVGGKVSRVSEQATQTAPQKGAGGAIPRASELAHKGLGIKAH